ncbi:uncharacterized protein EAF01_009295 [Botrytis porri]|uniref:uncharacterized protein n=1 Tax=Botrytis porri TaxID=87229 RepID=UPI0019028DED|nr:uncharacterized protein EAF01_009295 [Botrytis porri]KAF7896892.1 hypothetical protein EAF01_009295 [Botrytis porri]
MDGGLCLCNICCSEDASETSEDSPPQSPAQDGRTAEEELEEKYSQRCAGITETEQYEEKAKQTLGQGREFSEDTFIKLEKREFERIVDDEYESMGTKWEEMGERFSEGRECCRKCMLTGEPGNDSCSECEIVGDSNDVNGVEIDEEEDDCRDIVDGDWECSAEELEAAMCEDELFRSLYGDGQHMMQCCM